MNLASLGLFMTFSASFAIALVLFSKRTSKTLSPEERKMSLNSQLSDGVRVIERNAVLRYGHELDTFLTDIFDR